MNKKLAKHEKYLKKKIFFSNNKWPQYKLLINDIKILSKKFKKNSKILFLERRSLYGNVSLLAPFFNSIYIDSVECSPKNILRRKSYVKDIRNEGDIILKQFKNYGLKKNFFDLIVIPNLIHHLKNPSKIIKKSFKLLKKNGQIYIFEPTLREIHQNPEDYIRYTPTGMKNELENNNFKNIKFKTTGGPFTSTLYCLDQAIQYLPLNLRNNYIKNIFPQIYKKFIFYEKKFKKNLVRKHTTFPTAFSITGKK